jgi:hypothetical protein
MIAFFNIFLVNISWLYQTCYKVVSTTWYCVVFCTACSQLVDNLLRTYSRLGTRLSHQQTDIVLCLYIQVVPSSLTSCYLLPIYSRLLTCYKVWTNWYCVVFIHLVSTLSSCYRPTADVLANKVVTTTWYQIVFALLFLKVDNLGFDKFLTNKVFFIFYFRVFDCEPI